MGDSNEEIVWSGEGEIPVGATVNYLEAEDLVRRAKVIATNGKGLYWLEVEDQLRSNIVAHIDRIRARLNDKAEIDRLKKRIQWLEKRLCGALDARDRWFYAHEDAMRKIEEQRKPRGFMDG